MSRVARSARVASRQRTEVIEASKTIEQAESGEYYIVVHPDDASTLAITLPSCQEGSYFKFILPAALTNNSAVVTFTAQAGQFLSGGPLAVTGNGADPGDQQSGDGASHVTLTLDGNTDVLANGWLEFVSDGSGWYITGLIMLVDGGTASASIAFS